MPGSSLPTMLKSDLINRLAINLDTAEAFGPITEIWVNSRTHQVRGIGCSIGGLLQRQSRRFLWSQVGSLGRDGVVVKAGIHPEDVDDYLQDCLPLGELELWSDHGDRMGQLIDYRFDRTTGNIAAYLFAADGTAELAAGVYGLDPIAVLSTGRRRMMAEAAALSRAPMIQERRPQPTEAASGRSPFIHIPLDRISLDNIPNPRRGWNAALKGTQGVRDQVTGQFQESRQKLGAEAQDRRQRLQAEAQEKLGGLLGNVKKRTRHLRHQLREAVTDATTGLPAGASLRDDQVPTIDVDALELWPDDDLPPEQAMHRPQ